MKTIKLVERNGFDAKDVIREVIGRPKNGVTVELIRQGLPILDALDKAANGTLTVEDAQYELLKREINETQFAVRHRDLLTVLDAILTPIE